MIKDNDKKIAKNINTPSFQATTRSGIWQYRHYLIFILALTLITYLRVFANEITYRDDESYTILNPLIKSLGFSSLGKIFTSYYMGNYHPFTMILYLLGNHIGGAEAWPFQMINLFLHLSNTVLVFCFETLSSLYIIGWNNLLF